MTSNAKALGLALGTIAVIAVLCAAALASYNGVFQSTTRVYLHSERAGLLLVPGSDVKMSGVVVGRVSSVDLDVQGEGAVIAMDLESDKTGDIPDNVDAVIDPTTLFGRKFVSFEWPSEPSHHSITEGMTLGGSGVTVEVNDTFATLLSILDSVDPKKVNSTLTAVSTALQGRGEKFGDLASGVDTYLSQFNGSMPVLQRDIPLAADNIDTFADATPDFLETVDNLSRTSDTVVEKQSQLASFLLSFTEFGNAGSGLLDTSAAPLVGAASELAPTTEVLDEYSPMYPCFFGSLNTARQHLEAAFGGNRAGLNVLGTVLMGDPPYTYPENAPRNDAGAGPNCYGYPFGPDSQAPGHTNFDDGSDAYTPVEGIGDLIGNPFASLIYGLTR